MTLYLPDTFGARALIFGLPVAFFAAAGIVLWIWG